jgi:hypothetical protein
VADAVAELISALQSKLREVRNVNGNQPTDVPFVESNLRDEEHAATPARVAWVWEEIDVEDTTEMVAGSEEPIAIRYLVANHNVRILHKDREQCVALLMDLVTASHNLPQPDRFDWDQRPGRFETQVDGKLIEGGRQLIIKRCLIRIPIPAEPVGTTEDVIVLGPEIRAGIENPVGEDPDGPGQQWEVNRWTG